MELITWGCHTAKCNYSFPLAVAIVLSGMYEDDLDNAEDVIYTGQGGQNLTGNKRQIRDQKMERGNLALKNCIEQGVPVRVVRGHESATSYCGKLYTYDGLYKVIQYWAEKGISGFTVFKFRLRRIEGQSLLTTNQVQFIYGRVPKSVSEIRGLVCEDIAGGQEDIPIPATNLVDDPPVAPIGFTYCKFIKVARGVKLPPNANGCDCKESCITSRTCSCAKLNGSDFPYVQRDGGRLIEAKDVVYECGPNCGCGVGCVNRTSQRGIKYRLEVFRTPKKGWAVRSWDFIPSGAPVCEYTGILARTEDLDHVSENNYIFDIDCLQTIRGIGGRERRSRDASLPANNSLDVVDDRRSESVPEFCIDACSTGNIARFINHSCEPNLFVQCVLSSHHDIKLARVVLFAAENIPPLQELTYDYGYALDSVYGPDGKIKQMPCFCGATECRKRLF
ncbi:histone-lysine N-methyltransferase, H3 lysine-9 specific SUVH4 isoform X2 [Cucumis melo]|uniref:Histone-lysine N-methyltransferase, H3 lysine-9 specific SUVH4 isoform X2 n=1 Tax=Cucumis melo TaxID=3656 RepID=A0ABM3KUZ4_CUCME|nr:histone-lysine N-methyltransferase, H3 lysine-9 specific SUVH4 isoform X2 [Cucumis melo]